MTDQFMETMQEAMQRFERRGFRQGFRAAPKGRLTVDGDVLYEPEELVVEEVARFEGTSDPADEAVLFALRTADGKVRGTFVATYGPQAGPEAIEAVRRLDLHPDRARPEPGARGRRS
jgi:hypothetical protein